MARLILAYRYHLVDGVNLLVHEAGHVLVAPLGEVAGILGGTALQFLLPAAFAASFWSGVPDCSRRARRSASCFTWWPASWSS